jgi:hypothetical protein
MFDNKMDPLFMIVYGYQRALGELMIRSDDPSRARYRQCIWLRGILCPAGN